ncbi:MAG: PH domain-containing protein [Polyangiaceae bacterium]
MAPAVDTPQEDVLFEGGPALVPGIGSLLLCILTLGLALPVLWFRRNGKRYKITTQRLVVEVGLFSKTMEQIDLYRITDYVVERPFGQRMLGTGNLVLEAIDSTTPMLRLDGLKTDVVALYEKLRIATEAAKQRRGVRVVDYGEPGVPVT